MAEKEKKERATTLNEFKKILKLFKVMLDDGSIKLEFAPSGVGIDVDATRLDEELSSSDINKELFDKGVGEIAKFVNTILRDREKKFLERFPKKERKDAEQKCKLIEDRIITKELIDKFLFQTTCKNYLLSEFDWEIIEHFGKEKEESFSTAVIQLELRNPSRELLPALLSPKGDIRYVSFECDKENIERLIKELENAKEKLEK